MSSNTNGCIYLNLSKLSYSPNDQVTGTISLHIKKPYPYSSLSLHVIGYEKVTQFNNHGSVSCKTSDDPNSRQPKNHINYLLKHEFQLSAFEQKYQGLLPANQYEIPFQFILPGFLPNTFSENWYQEGLGSFSANTNYIIKGILSTKDTQDKNFGTLIKEN